MPAPPTEIEIRLTLDELREVVDALRAEVLRASKDGDDRPGLHGAVVKATDALDRVERARRA